jgi:hypothetical protein
MKATARIDAGICGFVTEVTADSQDDQTVRFSIRSTCDKIQTLAGTIDALGPVDAYQEINPRATGPLMSAMRNGLCGCCSGCAVPVGIFKSMQVAAGLALPKDLTIAFAPS